MVVEWFNDWVAAMHDEFFPTRVTKKEKAAAVAGQKALSVKVAAEGHWVRGASDGEVRALFADIRSAFNKAGSPSNIAEWDQSCHVGEALPLLDEVEREWFAVDRLRLSDADGSVLFDVVMRSLPSVAGDYRMVSAQWGSHYAFHGKGRLDMHCQLRADTVTVQRQLRKMVTSLVQVQHAQWVTGYRAVLSKHVLVVPAVVGDDKVVLGAVQGLHGLWVKADSKVLGEVDRFFVDEVAARYFPDAWKLFQSFEGGDETLLGEARAGFLEQVGLMGRRLQRIAGEPELQALRLVEAHSSFLREVTA